MHIGTCIEGLGLAFAYIANRKMEAGGYMLRNLD